MNNIARCLMSITKSVTTQRIVYLGRRQNGSSSKLLKLIEGIPTERINDTDGRGWNALMMAAKEGDTDAVNALLDRGAETRIVTATGHSAYDIAVFWQREECAKILKHIDADVHVNNFFCFDGVSRNGNMRRDEAWIKETIIKDTTEFILMHKASPVVCYPGKPSPKMKPYVTPKLYVVRHADIHHLVNDDLTNLTYIGQWDIDQSMTRQKGEKLVEKNIFCVDVSSTSEAELQELYFGVEVLPAYPGLLRLDPSDAGIAAQARSLVDWNHRYKFCPSCGSKTTSTDAGNKRVCTNNSCSTHKGKSNTNYPRVDATVLSAVFSRDNTYSLLARQKGFPPGMYSCLAGFIEPGESVEQACRREVNEEVGLVVTDVRYHSSQPWPMPSALMLGCVAHTDHNLNIEVDYEELEDAQWFTRNEVVLMMMHHHPDGFFIPPPQALGHRLIKDWLVENAFET